MGANFWLEKGSLVVGTGHSPMTITPLYRTDPERVLPMERSGAHRHYLPMW